MGHGFTIKPYINFPKYDYRTGQPIAGSRPQHTSAEASGYVIEVDDNTTFAEYTANGGKTNSEVKADLKVKSNVEIPYIPERKKANKAIEIYAKHFYGITNFTQEAFVAAARKHLSLKVAIPMVVRRSNFALFESTRFNQQAPWGAQLEGEFKQGTKAYLALKRYSETEYGSEMIDRINKSDSNFIVYAITKGQQQFTALGGLDYIRLPVDFPKLKAYPFSNQAIDPQATIHHEFEHTKFGSSSHSIGSLVEEVKAVTELENPARIIDGYEPRYVYYQRSTNTTVSVFDFNTTMHGGRTFDPNDPRILK